MKRAELLFENKFREELKKIPNSWWIQKTVATSLRGTPDIIGVVNGTFVALELKVSDKVLRHRTKTSELQQYNISKIIAANGYARIVTPEKADKILEELRGL